MKQNNYVLIVENNQNGLKPILENVQGDKKEYRLSGIFTEFDKMNRNERIYTSEKFIPHLNELVERKNSLGVVYGEFDHPDVFDTSLARVSHTIEKLYFNKEMNRVDGEIRLLNTHWGKEAKSLVDDGLPLFVSSRAAGITESDGSVTVKKLFTYDAVADPGFGSAKMSLNESISKGILNESLGFSEKTSNFRIFDISDESKINELFNMNQNDFVTKKQMVEYSDYLTTEVDKVKTLINESVKNGSVEPSEIQRMSEVYENLQEQQTKITKYLDYLTENIQIVVTQNSELKETTDKLKSHNDYLAENLDKSIKYSEYLSEQLDKNINYAEYIAETLDKNIDFSEYIAEHVNKNIQFSDYLAENIEKSIDYSEYIAENVEKNIAYSEYIAESLDKTIDYSEYIAENLDNNIAYSEYLAENLDNNIAYSEYLAENLDQDIAYTEYIAEHVDNNIDYAEYIAENVSDNQAYMKYIAEGLDNTIENIKTNKLFENVDSFNMTQVDNVEGYYEEDDDFKPQTSVQPPVETTAEAPVDVVETPVDEVPVETPVEAEVPVDEVPIEEPVAEVPVEEPVLAVEEPTMEGEPLEQSYVKGAIVSFDVDGVDKTGEILAVDGDVLVVKTTEDDVQVEIHESNVTIIGDSILETENSLKNYMATLLTEVKKRKASEENEPHFLQFLTEKNKQHWYDLTSEDKEKVIFAVNESGTPIYTEVQLLNAIKNSLSVRKTFDQVLVENMPSDLSPVWESLNEEVKKSILSTAKLYPNLETAQQFENFWQSRKLDNYIQLNESKQVVNENRVVDNSKLSDAEIDAFINRIKNI